MTDTYEILQCNQCNALVTQIEAGKELGCLVITPHTQECMGRQIENGVATFILFRKIPRTILIPLEEQPEP